MRLNEASLWNSASRDLIYNVLGGSVFSFPYQAEQSKEEQKQDLNAEKLMRQVSKDVCRLREQSRKVPRQVQSFR